MAWPRGKSRKEYFAQKKAAEIAAKADDSPQTVDAQPEVRARPVTRGYASMKAAPKRPEWKMKAGNLWDTDGVSPDEASDVLYIPRESYPEGVEFMWGTRSVRGQDMPQIRNGYRMAGWLEVHNDDFEGSAFWDYSRNRWARDDSGFIVHEACILLANREEVVARMTESAKKRAKEQLQIREQSIIGGGIAATGANHPSAIGQNRITRSVERIEVPKD